ncbi:hypothetical protein N7494_007472 [Penicillium frequentans]|uniref:Uncharacterized protein n=1 Tax=Penicillium frequentans TaxID=3151616 RepID=A0AAD6CSS9_9EURO|nr:hypothetical protein N7494_007472 [Penicillium glabrum]
MADFPRLGSSTEPAGPQMDLPEAHLPPYQDEAYDQTMIDASPGDICEGNRRQRTERLWFPTCSAET